MYILVIPRSDHAINRTMESINSVGVILFALVVNLSSVHGTCANFEAQLYQKSSKPWPLGPANECNSDGLDFVSTSKFFPFVNNDDATIGANYSHFLLYLLFLFYRVSPTPYLLLFESTEMRDKSCLTLARSLARSPVRSSARSPAIHQFPAISS